MKSVEEFVADVLTQITRGVSVSQGLVRQQGGQVNPTGLFIGSEMIGRSLVGGDPAQLIQLVEFDLAVTVQEEMESKAGIGIFAGGLAVGTQAQAGQSGTSLNRVRFAVPMALPPGETLGAGPKLVK